MRKKAWVEQAAMSKRQPWRVAAIGVLLGAAVWLSVVEPRQAWADRPFIATDRADPVEKGQTRFEMGVLYQQFSSNEHLSTLLIELTNGMLNDLDFEVEVPILFMQANSPAENGLGDVTLKAKVRWLRAREGRPVSLATELMVKLPTCNKDKLSEFDPVCTGETDVGFIGIASKSFHSVDVHLNVGYTIIGNTPSTDPPLRDTLNYSLGFEYPVPSLPLNVTAEIAGHTISDPTESIQPLVVLFGLSYRARELLVFDLGLVKGLTNSSPDFALTGGVTYQF
jgi:hypothetical protein